MTIFFSIIKTSSWTIIKFLRDIIFTSIFHFNYWTCGIIFTLLHHFILLSFCCFEFSWLSLFLCSSTLSCLSFLLFMPRSPSTLTLFHWPLMSSIIFLSFIFYPILSLSITSRTSSGICLLLLLLSYVVYFFFCDGFHIFFFLLFASSNYVHLTKISLVIECCAYFCTTNLCCVWTISSPRMLNATPLASSNKNNSSL